MGFTLIELVLVVVILGILAAIALPKYVNLSAAANSASRQALGVAITQATYQNSVAYAMGRPEATPVRSGAPSCSRAFAQSMLLTPIPDNVTFSTQVGRSCATAGTPTMRCMAMVRSGSDGGSVPYVVHCAGN